MTNFVTIFLWRFFAPVWHSLNNGQPHCDSWMHSAQRAFYSLQGAGLCYKGVDPKVAINIFQTAVQTTLTYGCDNIFMSRIALNRLDSFQAKLLKSILGVGKQSRTTPVRCLEGGLRDPYP